MQLSATNLSAEEVVLIQETIPKLISLMCSCFQVPSVIRNIVMKTSNNSITEIDAQWGKKVLMLIQSVCF